MLEVINVPEIIPNNIKQLRALRGITIEKMSEDTSLTYNYILNLENHKSNMSGITALRIMRYLDANFYQMFDINKSIILPYLSEASQNITINIDILKKYIDQNVDRNIIYIEEAIKNKLKELKKEGEVSSFKIIERNQIDNNEMANVLLEVTLLQQSRIEETFNIHFLREMNYLLFEELTHKEFIETKSVTLYPREFEIYENNIRILDKNNILKKGKPLNIDNIIIKNEDIIFEYDENENIKFIKLNILYEKMNHIKYIQSYHGLTPKDVQKALGISSPTYRRIVNGQRGLSSKLMWKITKLFKVPLELIINIPLYIEKFEN